MCLEFLCSWCHKEEDGPEHHTSLQPSAGTEYPARGESPSKPRSERSSNGTDTWNGDTYPGRQDPPSKPRSEMSSNGTDTWNDDTHTARHDPPKPRSERPSNGTDTWNGNTNPARQDPPLKPRPEPYSGNKNPVVSGVAVNNGDTKRKGEALKETRPSVLARPQVANNTVLAAPVQQPNLRRGADSNLMHTNNHYPTVGDSAQRNGHMRKDEEEEEEEVSKAAQTKNRRY